MKVDKNNSWKEKIDPAFDDLIKVYLDYIKLTRICSTDKHKRYLSLDDESLKVLACTGYPPLLKEFKPNPKNLKELINYIITIGANPNAMLILECFNNMENLFNKNEKKNSKGKDTEEYLNALKLDIMSMINGLPQKESRNYYKKRLKNWVTPEETKPFVEGKTQKEIIKDFFEMLEDILCLKHQAGIRGYWDSHSESYNDKVINKSNLTNIAMLQIYNAISIMTYKKSLGKLFEESRSIDESLFKAIHLDKTLCDEDWVRERIRKAFYSGDSTFLKELGKAIEKPPIPAKLMYGELVIILSSLWFLGLCRLDNSELMELLKTSGVPIQEDIETFRKYIDRLKDDNVLFDLDRLITIKESRT